MKARKILKGHRWFPSGGGCSCGPVHDPNAPKSERKGCLVKVEPILGMGALEEKDRPLPAGQQHPGRGSKSTRWAREMRRAPCHYCGGYGGTIDHVIPRSKGGRLTKENCVPACSPCNNWRKDTDYEWFKTIGWKTRPFAQ